MRDAKEPMKLAIMQPYFFPHLGYFQLIHAVDSFVVYDDVNYIKGGWINRNFILCQGLPQRLTLSLEKASPNRLINDISVGSNNAKLLKTIAQNYGKAPYFSKIFPLVEEIIGYSDLRLGKYLFHAIQLMTTSLGIDTQLIESSAILKNNELKGVEKVVDICKTLEASHYINSPGGRSLYDHDYFQKQGLALSFIEPLLHTYRQFDDSFVPRLSILDVLMFNSKQRVAELLESYELA